MGQEVNSSATDLDQSAVEALNQSALEYHRLPRPGKIAVLPIKGMTNQRDLALAYSPVWMPRAWPSMPIQTLRPCTRAVQPRRRGLERHSSVHLSVRHRD
jgi:hypothetical protein